MMYKKYNYPVGNVKAKCEFAQNRLAFMATTIHVANMFHTFHHIVPAVKFFDRLRFRSRSDVTLLPMPDVPPYDWKEIQRPVPKWHAFKLFMRALGDSRPEEELIAWLVDIVKPGRCTCFVEIFGGHRVFNPASPKVDKLVRRMRESIWTAFDMRPGMFAAVNMSTTPVQGQPRPLRQGGRVLFSLRRGSREIVNEDEVKSIFGSMIGKKATFEVTFADFATLPARDQVALVASSQVLVGVHGQGLAYTAMLPVNLWRCALIEIFPSYSAVHDYYDWSMANKVEYHRAGETPVYDCWEDFRACGSVRVDASRLKKSVEGVADKLTVRAHGTPLILYTVPPPKKLPPPPWRGNR
jgi:hypothetical protein